MNKKKLLIVIILVLTVLYMILSALGIAVITGKTGGLVYRLIIIAALMFACSRIISEALRVRDGGIATTVALGMLTFAVSEVYTFVYIYLMRGNATDITIGSYSRSCAYLFFAAVAMSLLPKAGKLLRIVASCTAMAIMFMIFYGIVIDNPQWLYYPEFALMFLLVVLVVAAYFRGNKKLRGFLVTSAAVCVLDCINRLMLILGVGWHWRDMALSLYPAVYMLMGLAMHGLSEKGQGAELQEVERDG